MITCEAYDCPSSQAIKINGKEILFFPFPQDDTEREGWIKNCQLPQITGNDRPLYVCELHFEKMSITDSGALKPGAVPTIFNQTEVDTQKKRKAESITDTGPLQTPPIKQQKLDEGPHSLVTPPQSPLLGPPNDDEEIVDSNIRNMSRRYELSLNGSTLLQSEVYHQLEMGKNIYRLTIQIDKILGKPCPRSKKFVFLMQSDKRDRRSPVTVNDSNDKVPLLEKYERSTICSKDGCKLRKSLFDSKPAFQCEHCDKYYISKKNDSLKEKSISCSVCHKIFSTPQLLSLHIKTHFVCDMCQTECSSRITYDKHIRLHVSTDPLYPYKCHRCMETFELKEDIRQHYFAVHSTTKLQNTSAHVSASSVMSQILQHRDYKCVSCNVTFRHEHSYRNHVNSHKQKEDLRCNISNINETNNIFPVPNPLTGSQIGILRAVKFSCRVCCMQFDNVAEVDRHTRTHLEDAEEERKCNICNKLFKTSGHLNEHLRNHLSRAHHCPLCPKAFINRTSLKSHLKTHGEA